MIIDEDILKDGIDEVLLAKLIGKHSLEQERYEKLYNYYIGKHAICERRRSSDNIANNKIVCNHAKYIVDIAKSYLVGNPVAYSCSDGYDIEAVKNCFAVQDMPSLDAEFEKTMSIFGKAYELVYADEQSQPKSVCLPPSNTFIVYGAGVGEIPLYGIHYYKKRDIDGAVTGVCCIVCDREFCFKGMPGHVRWINKKALKARYDLKDPAISDVDMMLQELLMNRVVLLPKYFHSYGIQASNEGGTTIDSRKNYEYRCAMKNKWGKYYEFDFRKNTAKINVKR